MTRAEAINTLANFKVYISGGGVIDKKANEALDMAIEALNCSEIPNKSDTISRSAAIDALDRIFDRCEEIEAHLPEGDPDRTGYKMYPDYMTVWKYLHQLPSSNKSGHWVMNPSEVAGDGYYICSNCNNDVYDATDFCPNCGSYNGGESDDKG